MEHKIKKEPARDHCTRTSSEPDRDEEEHHEHEAKRDGDQREENRGHTGGTAAPHSEAPDADHSSEDVVEAHNLQSTLEVPHRELLYVVSWWRGLIGIKSIPYYYLQVFAEREEEGRWKLNWNQVPWSVHFASGQLVDRVV